MDLFLKILLIVLAPVIGGFVYGFERIIKARMQRRIGPPLLQAFYDFLKLADKRKMIVHSMPLPGPGRIVRRVANGRTVRIARRRR